MIPFQLHRRILLIRRPFHQRDAALAKLAEAQRKIMSVARRRVLIQHAFGEEHESWLSATRNIHADYCNRHGIEYRVAGGPARDGRKAYWRKPELLREAMVDGVDQAIWLDSDCVIVKPEFSLFDASSFGIAVCECFDSPTIRRHLNAGVMWVTRSPDVECLLERWDAMPTGMEWEDQDAFNELVATRPFRDLLTVLPNRFNCLTDHMEARDPFIRAFHGTPNRLPLIQAVVEGLAGH
jgi:hypothetical protein